MDDSTVSHHHQPNHRRCLTISSASRSFLLARKRRGLRGLHLDTSYEAGRQTGSYEEGSGLHGS